MKRSWDAIFTKLIWLSDKCENAFDIGEKSSLHNNKTIKANTLFKAVKLHFFKYANKKSYFLILTFLTINLHKKFIKIY